jgi:hypothetical protein
VDAFNSEISTLDAQLAADRRGRRCSLVSVLAVKTADHRI